MHYRKDMLPGTPDVHYRKDMLPGTPDVHSRKNMQTLLLVVQIFHHTVYIDHTDLIMW